MTVIALRTARLVLRPFTLDDAPFVLELLNDPGWIRYIGDKGVRTVEGARDYLAAGPLLMYGTHGFGLLLVQAHDGTPLGTCGLIKRAALQDVDIGFAFLERHGGCGYASEAGAEVLRHARQHHRLDRVVAITDPDNHASAAVLSKLGLHYQADVQLDGYDSRVRFFSTR